MKSILGLDLGTTSIGWALVKESENDNEKSEIVKLGVRLVPLTTDERTNFEKGKSITTNADRTSKRSMRRNLQRYKLRREALVSELKKEHWIDEGYRFSEEGPGSTFSTLRLRAKAAEEEISLQDLAKVLLQINKKRGYKSSRKLNSAEDGQAIDGMSVAKVLYDRGLTPGEYVYQRMLDGQYVIPEFYKSDLQAEFDKIWNLQKSYYPELTAELYDKLTDKNKSQTWAICRDELGVQGFKSSFTGKERLKEAYFNRQQASRQKVDLEVLTCVLQDINGQKASLSGLLSAISDRSKELYFNRMTVGQMLVRQIQEDPNRSLRNTVFYRQDYIDEFEKIWSVQSRFHPELTPELKKKLKDIIIFYQRPLKSQKGLISLCEFESREVDISVDGVIKKKKIGSRVCPRSSPLFQEFKVYQTVNNILVNGEPLDDNDREKLVGELAFREKMKGQDVLKLLYKTSKGMRINFEEVEGNRTMATILKACEKIVEGLGYDTGDLSKIAASEKVSRIEEIFAKEGFKSDFLHFDSSLSSPEFESQASYSLWHLLYSYENDKSASGNESLIDKIKKLCSMDEASAKILSGCTFLSDYGSLSARAMRKILPYMKDGLEYSAACAMAGYRHSKRSLTKEELDSRVYVDRLELLPKNSLRNPVVEKILNQMINVVNSVVDTYGKPDEIRIEMARELKKSASEREKAQKDIAAASKVNESIVATLKGSPFFIDSPSRNDIIRYRLWEELKPNGYKTLYSGTYIPKERLFSKDFDIEHIIPQALLFDDSFANKTIESRQCNIEKSNRTAMDYVKSKYDSSGVQAYIDRVKGLTGVSKTKITRLLMESKDIPEDFINRELRDSQYIARKAREILESMVKFVVPTTGSVTARLREDWQLVNVMRELNWDKYEKLGLTSFREDRDGRAIPVIEDWTKRNDHRHHAMDALTIAFTRRQFIQYLNHLNAKIDTVDKTDIDLRDYNLEDISFDGLRDGDKFGIVKALQKKYLYKDDKQKYRFVPPMPLDEFRIEAKRQIEDVLVSFKAKNKVCTKNVNTTKVRGGQQRKIQFTPRRPLHNETIYGKRLQYVTKEEKVGGSFDEAKIASVCKKSYREALMRRLMECGGDPKKTFTGKNSLEKNPVWVDEFHSGEVPLRVRTVSMAPVYNVRKSVDQSLNIEKVLDKHIKEILRARLEEYGGNASKAFSNLDENPIWLNKEKGIAVKRATINSGENPIPLRSKRDKDGQIIYGEGQNPQESDFVATGGNHHAAIYRTPSGKLQDVVVSFYEAVSRKNLGLEVIDRNFKKDEGWEFLFTLKQNEYFVFPNPATGFSPEDYDLTDPANNAVISPNLYRVQKLSQGIYNFRHHLETTVEDNERLRDITWKRIGPSGLVGAVKVRIDNLGRILAVGEYD